MRKIANLEPFSCCRHPEHDPPGMVVLEPGIYEHRCPSCGAKSLVVVDRPTMTADYLSTDMTKGFAS